MSTTAPMFTLRGSKSQLFLNPALVIGVSRATSVSGITYSMIRTLDGGTWEIAGEAADVAASLWPGSDK